MTKTTLTERVTKLEQQYLDITSKLDKIIENEQKHIDWLIKAVIVIAVGERLASIIFKLIAGV